MKKQPCHSHTQSVNPSLCKLSKNERKRGKKKPPGGVTKMFFNIFTTTSCKWRRMAFSSFFFFFLFPVCGCHRNNESHSMELWLPGFDPIIPLELRQPRKPDCVPHLHFSLSARRLSPNSKTLTSRLTKLTGGARTGKSVHYGECTSL